jgi:hypothetical protein
MDESLKALTIENEQLKTRIGELEHQLDIKAKELVAVQAEPDFVGTPTYMILNASVIGIVSSVEDADATAEMNNCGWVYNSSSKNIECTSLV